MADVKNWVFLIILINVLLLPVMWLREGNSTPQVLGARESVSQNGEIIDENNTKDEGFNLSSWLDSNLWGNQRSSYNKQVRTIEGDLVSSDLPSRTALPKLNPDQGLSSMLAKNNNPSVEGKIELREGFKDNLAVNGFELGDKVILKCADKEIQTVIDGSFLGANGTLGVASQNIFLRLAVDPADIKELNCKITKI